MADDPADSLFDRLVDYCERRGRLVRLGPNSSGTDAQTRRALVRDSYGAIGQLEVASVMGRALFPRRLTWTPCLNVPTCRASRASFYLGNSQWGGAPFGKSNAICIPCSFDSKSVSLLRSSLTLLNTASQQFR
jgi:hypothetical protein